MTKPLERRFIARGPPGDQAGRIPPREPGGFECQLHVGLILPGAHLEQVAGVVLFLESPQALHGVLGEHAQHFRIALGHGVVQIRGHMKWAQLLDEIVAPLLAGRAL